MSSILLSLPELYDKYKAWVSKNPIAASDYEMSVKWVSFFIAGRINNSHVATELIYCLSNLVVMFNDGIIRKANNLDLCSSGETLKIWLTVVEYSEVFFELSAKAVWGTTGKWLVIVAVQVFKCISRLFLIYHHKENIIKNPAIPVLERRVLQSTIKVDPIDPNLNSLSFTLKRSGRVVRKIDSTPSVMNRDWKPLHRTQTVDNQQAIDKAPSDRQKLLAETIYIMKPMVHLASVACFGSNTWKPWMISLAMDAASLHLYKSGKQMDYNSLTPEQRLQISRRTVLLLLYLIKSPFYDSYSKNKIDALLVAFSNYVPLGKLIAGPLGQYLPFYQSTYFHMWST